MATPITREEPGMLNVRYENGNAAFNQDNFSRT